MLPTDLTAESTRPGSLNPVNMNTKPISNVMMLTLVKTLRIDMCDAPVNIRSMRVQNMNVCTTM